MASCNITQRPPEAPTSFHGIISVSPQMRDFFQKLERVARTDTTVLIRGESGTGKELAARALHAASPRSKGAFQAVNCATLTGELLASELFGHVRGAFTGAVRDKPGLFAVADGGTIFLDEIAELPLDLQARLLRVLQERTIVPLGATTPQKVDVRVISATNKALREEVDAGRFREDLMYRVRVVTLYLPPLRDREGDVQALTWHFIDRFNRKGWRRITGIAEDAVRAMCRYPWPGNVRELQNNIEQAFAVGEGPILQLDDLAPEIAEYQGDGGRPSGEATAPPAPGEAAEGPLTAADLERRRILRALDEAGGRKGEAAELLGVSRSTLWRKMKEHGI